MISSRKREHSRKPDELYELIEKCSKGPYLELFARGTRPNWTQWENEVEDYSPKWVTYSNHSQISKQEDMNYKNESLIIKKSA